MQFGLDERRLRIVYDTLVKNNYSLCSRPTRPVVLLRNSDVFIIKHSLLELELRSAVTYNAVQVCNSNSIVYD